MPTSRWARVAVSVTGIHGEVVSGYDGKAGPLDPLPLPAVSELMRRVARQAEPTNLDASRNKDLTP